MYMKKKCRDFSKFFQVHGKYYTVVVLILKAQSCLVWVSEKRSCLIVILLSDRPSLLNLKGDTIDVRFNVLLLDFITTFR